MRVLTGVAALVLCVYAGSARAADNCTLMRAASLDMNTSAGGAVNVPIKIGDETVNLLIDTGGIYSGLSEDVVAKLKLQPYTMQNMWFRVYGGVNIHQYVKAENIDLGGLKADSLQFLVFPTRILPAEAGGLLAPDILQAYDDDFDFANGKFNLFSQDHCEGKVVYWTSSTAVATIPFKLDENDHITTHVQLDGKDVLATFDTGAERSHLTMDAAEGMGITTSSADMKPQQMGDGRTLYRYPFKTLTFEGIRVDNPDIYITPDEVSKFRGGGPQLLLGMGVLRQLHLYIAYKEKKLYVTAASAH